MTGRRTEPIGYFGSFGGRYVPETLMAPIAELARAYDRLAGRRSAIVRNNCAAAAYG